MDNRDKPGYDGKMGTFSKNGFLWKRGNNIGEIDLPNISSRTPDVSPNILSACRTAVEPFLPGAFPVKTTLFAKSKKQTWALGWHQDGVIPVAEKHDLPGYKNWTRKDGVWHVEPPLEILNQMVFVQIYLDDVGPDDGPTELAIGTHKFGKIYSDQKDDILVDADTHQCLASRGDILICHALILHRSLASQTQNPRRILRLDFAHDPLPAPLRWNRVTAAD